MIITRLRLEPFGGLNGKELEFRSGLNVIHGPNESGKSTIFHAIQRALFTPVKLHKKVFEREIEKFIPVGGGDTIHVELHFRDRDNSYILKRTWGATKAAELRLPGGVVVSDDDRISEYIGSFLPAREGTFKAVLMTYQTGLERTLADLESHPETVHTLSDLLRKVVMETDGVSVDEFRENIQNLHGKYFKRWDYDKQYPEGNRGINNPWTKGVGLILDAFYKKEMISKNLEYAHQCEEELDELNQHIVSVSERVSEEESFIRSNKKAVEDARERRTLNAELKAIQAEIEEINKVNSRWPVIENQIESIKKEIPELEGKEKLLLKEKSQADQEEKNRALRERFSRIEVKKKALEEAGRNISQVKRLKKDNLEEIRDAYAKVNELKASLEAGRLAIDFTARKALVLHMQRDLEEEIQEEIKGEEVSRFSAGGRLKIKHPDWLIEVTSGEGNFEEIKKRYDQSQGGLEKFLKQQGVETLEKAIEVNNEYERYLKELEKTKENYESELGEDSYEDLKSKVEELGEEKETRPGTAIVEELVKTQDALETKKKEIKEHQKVIEEFIDKYEDKKKLLLRLAKIVEKEQDIKRKIENLAPLPEGVEDIELFIREYKKTQEEIEKEKEEKSSLEIKRAGLEERMPEESAEELERQLADAEENYRNVLRKGEAIARIKELTEKMLEKADENTYQGLKEDLERYVAMITENRYSQVDMKEDIPQGFIRGDGEVLFYELLSYGTKDVLGLALRLSMANHFLRDSDGFLAMDDPLVNMDPKRQEKAAELLKTYATQKQVLVFTCHPSHAELLGGNKIVL